MAYFYALDSELQLVYIKLSGSVNFQTLIALRRTIQADPAYDARFDALADVTAIAQVEIGMEELLQLGEAPARGRIGILARSATQVEFARIFGALRSSQDAVLVTPYLDEALKWLGRPAWNPPRLSQES